MQKHISKPMGQNAGGEGEEVARAMAVVSHFPSKAAALF